MSTTKQNEPAFDPRKHIKALVDDQHIKFSEEIYRDLLKQSVTRLTEKDIQEAHKRLLKKHKESVSTAPDHPTPSPTPAPQQTPQNQKPKQS